MIAAPQQDQIEIYLHPDGNVVIRQHSPELENPDIVLIAPENVDRVIRALRAVKREALGCKVERAA